MIESTDSAPSREAIGVIPGLALLFVRGILLWIVIPLGFLAWVVFTPWLHGRRITLGQFLGWVDNNVVAARERSVLRPLFRRPPQPWIRACDIERVHHRIGKFDLY
ncbi:hypothetical protein [Lacisediminihabitans sp. H27-G8]|uniref:hypothetical protein n=1 Tax=Lacisediminihabitans sp. H27-G8 TaxID=3111909 RepID=UPI0038FCA6F6